MSTACLTRSLVSNDAPSDTTRLLRGPSRCSKRCACGRKSRRRLYRSDFLASKEPIRPSPTSRRRLQCAWNLHRAPFSLAWAAGQVNPSGHRCGHFVRAGRSIASSTRRLEISSGAGLSSGAWSGVLPKSKFFPPAELAEPEGVVMFGGRVDRRVAAGCLRARHLSLAHLRRHRYRGLVVARPAGHLRVRPLSRLAAAARTCRSGRFEVTCDRDFAGVIHGCATARDRPAQHLADAQDDRGLHRLHRWATPIASKSGTRASWRAARTE